MKTETPFGSWPSPITAKFITQTGVKLGGLSVDDAGALHWLEARPQEGGRQVVVRHSPDTAGASARGAIDVTPAGTNVRTRVHEYGGGAHVLAPKVAGGGVIYSDFATQRLFWIKEGAEPMALTPESDAFPNGRYRFADGCVYPSGRSIAIIREDHGEKGDRKPSEVVNELVSIALDGSGEMVLLASGRDFYSNPRVSPSGELLAYICWDHPSMPWDTTELRVASLAGAATHDTSKHILAAGADGDTSVMQPAWHASGALYYMADASGFYQLMRVPPPAAGATSLPPAEARTSGDVDFGGSAPGWRFGDQGYAFLPDGRLAAHYPDRSSGRTVLLLMADTDDAEHARASKQELSSANAGLPHTFAGLAPSPEGSTLYMLGGSPDAASGVYAWKGIGGDAAQTAEMLACSSSATLEDGYVSVAQPVEFPSPLGSSYGFYYPPRNAKCNCASEAAPPLLVKAHGGPTACTSPSFNPSIQFWTSRGFAVLDVDYGGSTGYGREYRRRLRGSWGIVDIDDVCAGAQYLVSRGLADPKRLCIDGGSAGGYTTLGALAFKDVFTAGTSLYGVADLATLAGDTHKFESRYLDGLVGRYPEEKELYAKRAPINSVETLSCPILLLQGDEDKIVPPNQAELMHKALLEKGIPTALKMYVGEQHGFRKAENIEDALNSEYYFYSRVFGFECAGDDVIPFTIDNLPVAA